MELARSTAAEISARLHNRDDHRDGVSGNVSDKGAIFLRTIKAIGG